MKSNIPPLQTETYYHIYNRGINGENLFKEPENYDYFLKKYRDFVPAIADTYAYSLLKNHFHLLIRTKTEAEIQLSFPDKGKTASALISLQFSHLFNGYTQGINKTYNRTGSLFETPFRRKVITDDAYLRRLIFYIHYNPENHRLTDDFTKYPYSSYRCYSSNNISSFVKKDDVLNWFGGEADFVKFHLDLQKTAKESIDFN